MAAKFFNVNCISCSFNMAPILNGWIHSLVPQGSAAK